MAEQLSKVESAISLEGEFEQLQQVLSDLANHDLKRQYAKWLTEQADRRGAFLSSVLDDWDSGKETLTTDESIDAVWQDTCGVTLLQKIRSGKLDSVATSILAAARPALKIELTPADGDVPVGTTKFGGQPDLAEGVSWPEYEDKLHTFIGQFRLDDLRHTQAGTLLPDTGLLSFFVFDDPIETGQPAAEGAQGAWQVIYCSDPSQLRRVEPPKEFDEGNRLAPECILSMQETLDLPNINTYDLDKDYGDQFTSCRRAKSMGMAKEHDESYEAMLETLLPEREERSHLMGWSHPQVSCDDPVDDGFRHLLTVASEELVEWCWADGHQLYYSIKPEDLADGKFDKSAIIDG